MTFRMLNTKDHYDVEDTSLPALPPSRAEALGFNAAQQDALTSLLIDVVRSVINAERERVDKDIEDLRQRTVSDTRAAISRKEKRLEGMIGELYRTVDEIKTRLVAWEERWGRVDTEYVNLCNALGMLLRADTPTRQAIEQRYGAEWAQALVDAIHGKKAAR